MGKDTQKDKGTEKTSSVSYKDAGVDIQKAGGLVKDIKNLASQINSSKSKHQLGNIGGFASLFEVPSSYKNPVIATATDGVGTKLALARSEEDYVCLGVDLVAMCVNDLICNGAQPQLFLDYYATGELDEKQARAVIKGICEGCRQADCLLVGGETAEMPGIYKPGEFELAGFAVGLVEKAKIISPQTKADEFAAADGGDISVVGLRSNGVHANGFSLVRKLLETGKLELEARDFMRPTRIYVQPLLKVMEQANISVLGLAHITGGGLTDNLPRALPQGFEAQLDKAAILGWLDSANDARAELFRSLRQAGNVSEEELLRTFNCGIGMALVCPQDQTDAVCDLLKAEGEEPVLLGQVRKCEGAGAPPQVKYV